MSAQAIERPDVDVALADLPDLDAEVECCYPGCDRQAKWLYRLPCGHGGPLCRPHLREELRSMRGLAKAGIEIECLACGAKPLNPDDFTWRRL